MIQTSAEAVAIAAGVVVALFFCFTNGFQDAGANTATIVASRSLNHRRAAILAAIAGLLGAIIGGSAVAFTVFNLIDIQDMSALPFVTFAAVVGAAVWNLLTWRLGIPSSSSYSLIGGLIGAALASEGMESVNWGLEELLGESHELIGVAKVFVFLVLAIVIGLVGGYVGLKISGLLLRNSRRKVNETIKKTQLITTSIMAFAAGANNAQKHMGVIALLVASYHGTTAFDVPLWVRVACSLALTAGALIGGWRIMRTLGRVTYEMEPVHAIDSQAVSATSIGVSTVAGSPISSTQVIASSIVGVGAANNAKKVRWSVGRDMAVSWILTIPASLIFSGAVYLILDIGLGL